jgi:hypothetical protein
MQRNGKYFFKLFSMSALHPRFHNKTMFSPAISKRSIDKNLLYTSHVDHVDQENYTRRQIWRQNFITPLWKSVGYATSTDACKSMLQPNFLTEFPLSHCCYRTPWVTLALFRQRKSIICRRARRYGDNANSVDNEWTMANVRWKQDATWSNVIA